MTATATAPDEQLVAQPRKVVTFISRRQNLRLVMKARRPERSPVSGEVIGEISGYSIQFDVYIDPVRREQLVAAGVDEREAQAAARYGRFECPTEGPVMLEFGHELEDAAALFEWMSKHRLNGDALEGFWRVDPSAPKPAQGELERLMRAAEEWDIPTLQAIIEQERAGWNREEIIRIAEGSIERINVRDKQLQEHEAAQAAAAKKAAEKK